MVLCDTGFSKFKFVDSDMEVTMGFSLRKPGHIPKHVAAMDSKTIIVSKLLQFLSVRFGKEIVLTCDCDGLAAFKNKLYVFTRCLDERPSVQYEGFQILSLKGEILKTVPLFDDITCFSLNKQ